MNALNSKSVAIACLAVCAMLVSGIGRNVPSLSAQQAKQADESSQEKTRQPPRGRVPAGLGKIGVSEKQKEEIYAIQARYRTQVDELLEQLEELKAQEAAEIHNVLTENQKLALKEYREEAAARRKAKTTPTE